MPTYKIKAGGDKHLILTKPQRERTKPKQARRPQSFTFYCPAVHSHAQTCASGIGACMMQHSDQFNCTKSPIGAKKKNLNRKENEKKMKTK